MAKAGETGFNLDETNQWNFERQDQHFAKFFTELFAMVFAKHLIGVKYTNVSWVSIARSFNQVQMEWLEY